MRQDWAGSGGVCWGQRRPPLGDISTWMSSAASSPDSPLEKGALSSPNIPGAPLGREQGHWRRKREEKNTKLQKENRWWFTEFNEEGGKTDWISKFMCICFSVFLFLCAQSVFACSLLIIQVCIFAYSLFNVSTSMSVLKTCVCVCVMKGGVTVEILLIKAICKHPTRPPPAFRSSKHRLITESCTAP